MKKLVLFCVVFAALLGGFWDGKIAAAPNNVVGSIAIDQPAPYALGDTLTFTTTIPKLKGYQYPMIVVACYQDVDGNGTVEIPALYEGSPDLVYAWLDHPDQPFVLGATGDSGWRQNGGPAECKATLYAYSASKSDIDPLAPAIYFHAEG